MLLLDCDYYDSTNLKHTKPIEKSISFDHFDQNSTFEILCLSLCL